jgi:dipeptidyl aminopeptidase/acylaminoacyl peptidase
VFDSNVGGHFEVYVMNAGGGAPRKLTATPKSESVAPSWSHDGQWIYFHSDRSGTSEIWRMPAAGGEAVQITRKGGTVPVESPDGKSIYYCLGNTLRKVPVDGGDEITVAENVEPRGFSMIREGIFLLRRGDAKRSLEFLDWNTGQVRHLASFEKPVTIAIAASPDGRHILYPQVDQQLSDLMLVENFR